MGKRTGKSAAKSAVSQTPATKWLADNNIPFTEHVYEYVEHGGAGEGARQLGVSAHSVVKTLIMQDEAGRPLVVLMHGDCEVSTKNLARQAGYKAVQACQPGVAQRHSGYQVGGTSVFGLRKPMPLYVQASILTLALIYINGGRRGYLLGMDPDVLISRLPGKAVECALGIANPPKPGITASGDKP